MKALIAMSGGVDSSLAAKLVKDEGFECIGCTMKLFDSENQTDEISRTCCSLEDVEDARSVCYKLGIPYYVFNFKTDFRKKVIQKFVDSYSAGITPNPCIDCNRYMKFDKLYERAKILDCDYIVTGHYAKIEKDGDRFVLKKAEDRAKDQSYVLYSMTQQQLACTKFPLGKYTKHQVRSMAKESGFINAAKPDSQDICFVPNGDYVSFLEQYTGQKYPYGNFISTDGCVLGRHKGTVRYTVGQRKGLGLSAPEPMYVTKIDALSNTVTVGQERDLYSTQLVAGDFNWICGTAPINALRCKVKIRYRHAEQWATVKPQQDGTVNITFDVPQRAVTPGQAAVLYDGDTVLGGGTII